MNEKQMILLEDVFTYLSKNEYTNKRALTCIFRNIYEAMKYKNTLYILDDIVVDNGECKDYKYIEKCIDELLKYWLKYNTYITIYDGESNRIC